LRLNESTLKMLNEATRKFVSDHWFDDVRKLALQTRSFVGSDIDYSRALLQIAGRQFAENKIPSWFHRDGIVYPPHLALEQCSSEQTARYKAELLSGNSFVDLTGGFGVDFAFISENFRESYYVEKQKELCEIATLNFKVLGLINAWIISENAVEYLEKMPPVDAIFIDPGRRTDSGKKLFNIEEADPDILQIRDLLLEKSESILIKLSPMLDISMALKLLKNVAEVHVVSLENECKELLFLLKRNFTSEPLFTCINISKKGESSKITFLQSKERAGQIDYTSEIGQYIYEPNTSLLKAGFYKRLTDLYPVRKLNADSHLYTSAKFIRDFPGRAFKVEAYSSFNKKELNNLLRDVKKASITVRNFPLSVAELRKQLKIKESGDTHFLATTLADGKHILLKAQKLFAE